MILVHRAQSEVLHPKVKLERANELIEPSISNREFFVLAKALPYLAGDLFGRLKDGIQRAKLLNPLGCRLWTYPWNALEVV